MCRKVPFLISFVLMAALSLASSPVALADFKLDFNGGNGDNQLGWTPWDNPREDNQDYTKDFSADFDDHFTIKLTNVDWRFRRQVVDSIPLHDLLDDDIKQTWSLTVTFQGLAAGTYSITIYHHNPLADTVNINGTVNVTVTDADGTRLAVDHLQQSWGPNPSFIGTATFTFRVDGSSDVVLDIENNRDCAGGPTSAFNEVHLNGFEISSLPTGEASDPKPADGQTDVPRDVVLSWQPGIYAPPINGHKVYFSESFNDVNDGIGGVIQDADSYTPPQRPDLGATYYWRIDEVNAPPDSTIFEGDVWSFTTEPVAYPVAGDIVATFKLDFNGGNGDNQLGWTPWDNPNQSDQDYTKEFSADFDDLFTIKLTNVDWRFRRQVLDSIPLHDLLDDALKNGSPFTVTFQGLAAGTYSITTYHHNSLEDTVNKNGTVNITVTDVDGTRLDVDHLQQSWGPNPPFVGTASFMFRADGSSDVVLDIKQNGDGLINEAFLNGLEIGFLSGSPRASVVATASSSNNTEEGPENTINSSGLDDDLHTREDTDMWLSSDAGTSPAWIQYELDRDRKLYQMLVWNYNSSVEPVVGFGIREATVEHSIDGANWSLLGTTHEFAWGPGDPDYASNTTIDFGGVTAKYVRITANSNWGGIVNQFGLSEVRFLYIPLRAREPQPESGATDVDVDLVLSFRAGREAAEHNVYISTDKQAVIDSNVPVRIVTEAQDGPISLDLGETYYWKVNEVNMAETPTMLEGDIWNFSTHEYFVVDDFEDYNDYPPDEIWATWVDGYDIPANGATVGYPDPDFLAGENYAETVIVHGGEQAMPFFYSNIGTAIYSEGERTFAVPQDWAAAGIQTLVLYFYGTAGNTGQLYVKVSGVKVAYPGDAADIEQAQWNQWNIDLASLGVNPQSVSNVSIGIDGSGASGTLYFDDIRLYRVAP